MNRGKGEERGWLAERRRLAREQRVAKNRSMTCATCAQRDTSTEAVPREAAQIPRDATASVMTWEVLIQNNGQCPLSIERQKSEGASAGTVHHAVVKISSRSRQVMG